MLPHFASPWPCHNNLHPATELTVAIKSTVTSVGFSLFCIVLGGITDNYPYNNFLEWKTVTYQTNWRLDQSCGTGESLERPTCATSGTELF